MFLHSGSLSQAFTGLSCQSVQHTLRLRYLALSINLWGKRLKSVQMKLRVHMNGAVFSLPRRAVFKLYEGKSHLSLLLLYFHDSIPSN